MGTRALLARLLPDTQTGPALIRQFAILALVVVGLITAGLCLVISSSLRKDLLEREWKTTADFIRTEAAQNLSIADFAAAGRPEAQARFRRFYDQEGQAAQLLGISRDTLRYRIEKHQLRAPA